MFKVVALFSVSVLLRSGVVLSSDDLFESHLPEIQILEQEKLIDDGGKYKNIFQVGDELKLLPEVMSILDFSPKDHAAPGDMVAEEKLRKASHWGRFYVDGWPSNLQYLRAHFGLETPKNHQMPIILADPWDACTELKNQELLESLAPVIILAKRGTCTFGTKANITERALGIDKSKQSALLLINNEPGSMHAPGPDAHDVQLSISMVSRDDGEYLAQHLRKRPIAAVNGSFVPINCIDHSETRSNSNNLCEVISSKDRDFVDFHLIDGGFIKFAQREDEYLLANFGPAIPAGGKNEPKAFTLRHIHIANTLCDPLSPVQPNTAIFIQRGGQCSFLDKALHAQNAGAAAVIIVNANAADPLLRPSCHPRWAGFQLEIPVILTSANYLPLEQNYNDTFLTLEPFAGGHQQAWSRLEPFANNNQWPRQKNDRISLFHSLSLELDFNTWPQRKKWLNAMLSLTESLRQPRHPNPSVGDL